jgi:hypothetical protein
MHGMGELKDCPVVADLHEFAPVVGRAASGRDGRRFDRFSEVHDDLPNRPRLVHKGNEPDVAATRWALERELFTYPSQEFRPGNP